MKNIKVMPGKLAIILIAMLISSITIYDFCLGDVLLEWIGLPAYINGFHTIVLCLVVPFFVVLKKFIVKSSELRNTYNGKRWE